MKYLRFLSITGSLLCSLLIQGYSQPQIVNIWQFQDTVGIYDKFEIRLRIDADFANPFNPGDITLDATFTSPSGKGWNLPGFFSSSGWSGWMVRFAPNELGEWSYKVELKDKNGTVESEVKKFLTIESPYHGPIRIGAN